MSHYRDHFKDGEVLSEEQLRERLSPVAKTQEILEEDEDTPQNGGLFTDIPNETQEQEDNLTATVKTYLVWGVLVHPDGWLANRNEGDLEAVQGMVDILRDVMGMPEYCHDEDCPESQGEDATRAEHHEGEEHNEGAEHHGGHTHSHTHSHGSAVGSLRGSFGGAEYQGGGNGIRINIQDNMVTTDTRRWRSGSRFHEGTDLGVAGNRIGTPLEAVEDGRVVYQGVANGYGNVAIVSHGDGVYSLYAHLDRFGAQVGQVVRQGQEFAYMGNTGIGTGPHLHLEIALRDERTGNLVTVDPELAEGRDLTDPSVRRSLIDEAYAEARSKVGFNLAGRIAGPEFNA